MYAESLSILEKTSESSFPILSAMGYAYAKTGRRRDAEEVIKRWKEAEKTQYVLGYWIAVTYVGLGDKDAAFVELEKAYQARDWFLPRIKTDPFIDPLRDDPRFKDLVRRIGLPD